MNQTKGLFGATVRGAGPGLPWLSVLAISASAAYAITVGVARVLRRQSEGPRRVRPACAGRDQNGPRPAVKAGAGAAMFVLTTGRSVGKMRGNLRSIGNRQRILAGS